MTNEEMQEMVGILADATGYEKSIKIIRSRMRHASARPRTSTIWIGVTKFWTDEEMILHEFSHLLDYKRNDEKLRRSGNGLNGRNIDWHGEPFRKVLLEVVTLWFKDPTRYTWSHEYKRIVTWAKARGLIKIQKEDLKVDFNIVALKEIINKKAASNSE